MMRCTVSFLLAVCVLLPGCGGKTEEKSAPASGAAQLAAAKPQVALVMKSLANEFFKTMEDGAKAHHGAQADRFDLITNGIKNEEDVGGQVALVEQMIARGVDAIVIAPADSKALIPVLARALEAGITVVNIDNKLDAEVLAERGLAIPFVGPDNRKGAKLAGAYVAGRLKPGDKVALINGVPSAFNGIQRRLGFEDAVKEAGLEIVSDQSANWEMAKASQVAAGIINEHADLKAILCGNDSMALGAVSALRDAGREDVLVAGFDNISAVQELMQEGRVLCTVDQHADELAVFGIQYALEILETGTSPGDRETPVDLITNAPLP